MNTAPTPTRVTAPLLIAAAAAAAIGASIATAAPAQAKPGHTGDTTTTTTSAEVNPGSRFEPPDPCAACARFDRFFDRFIPPNPVAPPNPIFGENRFLDRFFDRFIPPQPITPPPAGGGGTT